MEMMIRLQALSTLLWSVTVFSPRIRQRLSDAKQDIEDQLVSAEPEFSVNLLPMLSKHFVSLNEESAYDCTFQNVSLTPGWMVVGEMDDDDVPSGKKRERNKKKNKIYEWTDRSPGDCLKEQVSFTRTLIEKMDEKFESSVTEAAHILGKCLYMPSIYTHVQGDSQQLTAAQLALLQEHGKNEFSDFFSYICSIPHIKDLCETDSSLKFVPVLAPTVYNTFKSVIVEVIFNNLGNCRALWFPPIKSDPAAAAALKHGDSLIVFFVKKSPYDIDDFCEFHYGNIVCTARFDEKAAFSSMYVNEEIYGRIGQEMCIVVDIALAMSGSEAVVESYYSVMGSRTMPGGQLNNTLVQRTNIDWCFPMANQCEETIKEVAALYIKGDKEFGLKAHQVPVFIDERGRAIGKYVHGSKVLDRISKKDNHNFALCDKDKI